ncbi:MAG: SDR family oxidoreductase [Candidatus Nanopelagicales bacterium]|nr:SDR family oxidoreductase [Candidatus Nanopelagicales bacterium]
MATRRVLVFGATGNLGADCAAALADKGWAVLGASRTDARADLRTEEADWASRLPAAGPIDAVVWASGCNWNDTVLDDRESLERMLEGNLYYVQDTMRAVVESGALSPSCRFVVLSSVWQETARSNKFSYIVSKAALSGLVQSAMIDLAGRGITINAVLPGPVDTEMTRRNLTVDQMRRFEEATPIGRLVRAREVAKTVAWLCSDESSGVNGQSIAVDGGWLGARVV